MLLCAKARKMAGREREKEEAEKAVKMNTPKHHVSSLL
jgi:hypothetical protein